MGEVGELTMGFSLTSSINLGCTGFAGVAGANRSVPSFGRISAVTRLRSATGTPFFYPTDSVRPRTWRHVFLCGLGVLTEMPSQEEDARATGTLPTGIWSATICPCQ